MIVMVHDVPEVVCVYNFEIEEDYLVKKDEAHSG